MSRTGRNIWLHGPQSGLMHEIGVAEYIQGCKLNKLRGSWLALGVVWIVAIFYISLTPHPPQPVSFWQADKLEHALAYGLLMLWFCQIYRQRLFRAGLALLLVFMGIVIEYLQRESGYRTFDVADMLANATGVALGWAWARTGLGQVFAYIEYHAVVKNRQP